MALVVCVSWCLFDGALNDGGCEGHNELKEDVHVADGSSGGR